MVCEYCTHYKKEGHEQPKKEFQEKREFKHIKGNLDNRTKDWD